MNVVDLVRFGWKVLDGQIVRPAARDPKTQHRARDLIWVLGSPLRSARE